MGTHAEKSQYGGLFSMNKDGNNSCPISADDPDDLDLKSADDPDDPDDPLRPLMAPDDPDAALTTADDPHDPRRPRRPATTPTTSNDPARLPQEIFVRFDAPVSDLCSCLERIGL